MLEIWKSFWGELNTPDSFSDQPYEGALNQAGHIMIGATAAVILCLLWQMAFGEMPYRWAVGLGLSIGYLLLIECLRQGWQGADSVVDAAFVSLGVALPLISLREVRPGALEPQAIPGIVGLLCAAAALGLYVYPRARRKWGS